MTRKVGRLRADALVELAAVLPRLPSREAAAHAVAEAIGAGHLACCILTVDGDLAAGVAIRIGTRSGSRLDRATAERLIEYAVPVESITAVREVVHRRSAYIGTAGALAALVGMPATARDGADLRGLEDALVVAAPIEAGERVAGVVMAWGAGCDIDSMRLVEAGAGMLSLAWDRTTVMRLDHARPLLSVRRRAGLRRAVSGMLRPGRVRAALQPIVRLHDGAVMGWEALARFRPTAQVAGADELFAAASTTGLEIEVDVACLRAALAEGVNAQPAPLFVNVGVGSLMSEGFCGRVQALMAEARLSPSGVVIELSERDPVSDLHRLQRVTADLRAAGFRVAVDDTGSGHASMRIVAEIRPDFIKIDRSLIHDLATDSARKALVISLLSFGGVIGSRVIAEGVETEAERIALGEIGVQFGQGFHLGIPVMQAPPHGASAVRAVDATWYGEQNVLGFPAPALEAETAIQLEEPEPEADRREGRRSLPQALSEAARALQSEHDREGILRVIAAQLARVIPLKEIVIYAADYATHRFIPLLATGPDAEQVLADSFGLDAGLTGWAFATGTPQNIRDTSTHPMSRQIPGTPVGEESMLLLPLIAGDTRLGMLNCYRNGAGMFSAADLKAAALFAHMAASAWRNAQLYSELREAAMTDPLTGLLNTRWLHEIGERELARSVRLGAPHSVLLLDLDHFKLVNDCCGHAAGDTVLRRVARALHTIVRRSDAVVRSGGEEFLVMLPDTDETGATTLAHSVREALRRLPLPRACTLECLTASIGVASHPSCGTSLDELIRAADKALYVAKDSGRDRVVVAGPRDSPGPPPRRRTQHPPARPDSPELRVVTIDG